MPRRSRLYEESLFAALQDPNEAAEYLNAALEDGDQEVFLLALRQVVEANRGIGEVARASSLHRQSVNQILSEDGNPRLASLRSLLHAVGMKLAVTLEDRAA